MKKKYHYIYKTVNNINGKYYIGMHSTNNLDDGYVGSGKKLWYSIKKYGVENFKIQILEFYDDRETLIEREKELVNEDILLDENCMNLKNGGSGGFTLEQTKNGRKKTDDFLLKKYGENFRSVVSKKFHESLTEEERKEYGDKIKNGQIKAGVNYSTFNKKHTLESIEKMKLMHKINKHQQKENNSQFGKCWIYNDISKENKKIKKDDIDQWLKDGWIKGRKMIFK